MSHANARFAPAGRLLIVQRIEAGMPQAHVARQMGLSRGTVAKWWHRWLAEGEAGLVDRSSRPRRCPRRAQDWYWSNDMAVDEVLTDNGPNFVSDAFADLLAERRILHRRTRPYRPQTNGKAERFNRTLADEFLHNYKFRSENERRNRLKRWIHDYNCHRHHTAVGGPPASRANNLTRTDI